MKVKYLYLIVLLSFVVVSCNNKESKKQHFDYGSVENEIYQNAYFNFSVKLPADWNTMSQKQNQNLMKSTQSATLDTDKITTVILLTAYENEPGKKDSVFNANMLILAENIKGSTRIRTASDYLLLTRQTLEKEPVKREYPDKMTGIKNINGTEFSTLRVINSDISNTYSQDYYTVLVNDFAVTAILTYTTENERIILENAFGTFKFN